MRKFIYALLCVASPLIAQQVITVHDGVQLNWSQLRLTFSGTAHGSTWNDLEAQAWWQGFQHLQQVVPHLYDLHYPSTSGVAQQAAARVFRNLQVRETVFSSDRRVRLVFSSLLANVFTAAARAGDASLPAARHSGLILRAKQYFPPRAVYAIQGKSGQRYFDVSMVHEKHFRRGLMGRYFRGVTAAQVVRYVGRQPRELAVREVSPAVLEVDDRAWQEFAAGNDALLTQARIVVIFPASAHN